MNTNTTIDISNIVLTEGGHTTREQGMCAMEFAAYLAGEEHSDRPACVDPAIAVFMTRINDRMDAEDRQLLIPVVPLTLNTRTQDLAVIRKRAYIAADYAVRVFAARSLDLRGFPAGAAVLRALAPITDYDTAIAARDRARAAAADADAADAAADADADDADDAAAAADAAASAATNAAAAADADAADAAADADADDADDAAAAADAAASAATNAAAAAADAADAAADADAADADDAAAAAPVRRDIWLSAIECVRAMCAASA